MRTLLGILCACSVSLTTSPCGAQDYTIRDSGPLVADADTIHALTNVLSHTFSSRAGENQPALLMHVAPLRVAGLSDTFLCEVARADASASPFRSYVLQIYSRRGNVNLRLHEFSAQSNITEAIAGLWAAPQSLPTLEAAAIFPTMDMPVIDVPRAGRSDLYRAKTEHPVPANRAGATEMTVSLTMAYGSLSITEVGFDAVGKRVWGSEEPITFVIEEVSPVVQAEPNGLTIITTIPPKPDALHHEPGGEMTIHFTNWTSTGQRIQSTRDAGREPAKVRIPGAPFPALDKALTGIAKGERRKIVIPPALAYGEHGKGTVPPNATLIFDVECLAVDNSTAGANPPPGATPGPRANPHAPPPIPPPSSPTSSDQPIGTPPTNGIPEKPR